MASGQASVIYVLETTELAGGIKVVLEQASRLALAGVPTVVASLWGRPSWISCHAPVETFPSYNQLVRAIREVDAYKVATLWSTAHPVASAARSDEGYYLVQDIETSFFPDDGLRRRRVLETYDLGLSHLATSKWVQSSLVNMGKKSDLVGIAVDHTVFYPRPVPKARKRIVVNAPRDKRVWHLKGMEPLRNVLGAVASADPDVEIVSFAPEEDSLDIPGAECTHIPFPTDAEVASLYSSASCFLLTPSHEGFCLPALEAMACECPVVTTRAGGNLEFCTDDTCLFVDAERPDEAAAATLDLIGNEPRMARLADAGIAMASTYVWDDVIRNLRDVLNV